MGRSITRDVVEIKDNCSLDSFTYSETPKTFQNTPYRELYRIKKHKPPFALKHTLFLPSLKNKTPSKIFKLKQLINLKQQVSFKNFVPKHYFAFYTLSF